MPEVIFDVKLVLEGPVLTQSSGPGALGIDAPMAKNQAGQAYLPGTLVKGKLREAWLEITQQTGGSFDKEIDMLGRRGGNRQSEPGTSFDAHRARLFFSDFVDRSQPREEHRRVRVQIDSTRGAVEEHMLAVVESLYAAGETVTFEGTVRHDTEAGEDPAAVATAIATGLRWVHSFGAQRTVGFGRLIDVTVTRRRQAEAQAGPPPVPSGGRLELVLTTDQPFCVTESRAAENLFTSSDVIPGGVWKGALAQTWMGSLGRSGAVTPDSDPKRGLLAAHFEHLVFRHAIPRKTGTGAGYRVLPLSLVRSGSKDQRRTADAALVPMAQLVGGEAPAFSIDWKDDKDWKYVNAEFSIERPSTELRVRTAIEAKTRRAKDEALFAYEMIRPDGFEWLAEVDASRVDEGVRAGVLAQLAELVSSGIRGLGKTKAGFTVRAGANRTPERLAPRDGIYVIMLQTHALLADPAALTMKHGDQALHAEYERVWSELSGGTLQLKHYFAQQFLQGGPYLWDRFQKGGAGGYAPYLLTKAGSVFVFSAHDGADDAVSRWNAGGMDVPAWAKRRFGRNGRDGAHWTNNPYIPENGYSAVTVNANLHWEMKLNG